MTLSEKQYVFAKYVAWLIFYVTTLPGFYVTLGEAYRPREMAVTYSKRGIGIAKSKHTKRLAIDLNLFIGGKYQTQTKAYRMLGAFWKSMDPKNRWGGDFKDKNGKPKPDGNHFEYNG